MCIYKCLCGVVPVDPSDLLQVVALTLHTSGFMCQGSLVGLFRFLFRVAPLDALLAVYICIPF